MTEAMATRRGAAGEAALRNTWDVAVVELGLVLDMATAGLPKYELGEPMLSVPP